jgi:hypothetical protein
MDQFRRIRRKSNQYIPAAGATPAGQGGVYSGLGSPEGVVSASIGSKYTDITDPDMPVQYTKTADEGLATGWVG